MQEEQKMVVGGGRAEQEDGGRVRREGEGEGAGKFWILSVRSDLGGHPTSPAWA